MKNVIFLIALIILAQFAILPIRSLGIKGTLTNKSAAMCTKLNDKCKGNRQCCSGSCRWINGVDVCTCKDKFDTCKNDQECCSSSCEKRKGGKSCT